jgi:hypothetical protein
MPISAPPPAPPLPGARTPYGGICTDGSYNGFTWGAGSQVLLVTQDGIDDLPSMRRGEVARGHSHGWFDGPVFLDKRTITLTFTFIGNAPEADVEVLRAATNGYPDQQHPLYLFCSTRMVMAKVSRRKLPYDRNRYAGNPKAVVEFTAVDPRLYEAALRTASLPLQVEPTTGVPFPVVFPADFGGGTALGSVEVVNYGDFGTPPLLRIYGPVANPEVVSHPSGRFLRFLTTLASGDVLEVDTDLRSVTLNPGPGQVSRRSTLDPASTWFDLMPGSNLLRFQAPVATATSMSVIYRSAWA